MSSFGIIALTPPSFEQRDSFEQRAQGGTFQVADAAIAVAACLAGEIGVINLEFTNLTATSCVDRVDAAISSMLKHGRTACGIKCTPDQVDQLKIVIETLARPLAGRPDSLERPLVILTPSASKSAWKKAIQQLKSSHLQILAECTSVQEAENAVALGVDAVIAKGHEAAGRTGQQTTFVLLQELILRLKVPVWAEGGIGLHTAAACYAAGCAGVVLDSQLLLAKESRLPLTIKQKIAALDGTETHWLPLGKEEGLRIFARNGHGLLDEKALLLPFSGAEKKVRGDRLALVREQITHFGSRDWPLDRVWLFGQDVCFAERFARKYSTVGGIVQAIRQSVSEHIAEAVASKPLAAASPLAVSHGTRYPLVQGAMTRVSDTAEFALSVAEGGGLPFLALALMRKGEVESLVKKTAELLGHRPWGVGVLGFVPNELRQEQLEIIRRYKPAYALIAGGRPDQAKALDEIGIKTYLHVPSPLLLESFIEMGSRRFIFEGKECGGHVGPRSSFVLWESMIDLLLRSAHTDATSYHVLFAGGVHDSLSAAMVSAMAAPLAARGVRVGALMGTAYLFTREAVDCGAIVKTFQDAALDCRQTVLLETGPGHAIRCIDSPYKRIFDSKRQELTLINKSRDEIREELELMNLGRLRIASKGVTRAHAPGKDQIISELKAEGADAAAERTALTRVSEEEQWSDGMYMIGQVASMHDRVMTIEELHRDVSLAGTERLQAFAGSEGLVPTPSPGHLAEAGPSAVPVQISSTPSLAADGRAAASTPIAIVGMSCLFPKANDLETYWNNILEKVDAITEVPAEQWDWRKFYDENPLAPDKIYSKWGGFLGDIKFDPTQYGIPPSSLASIDPMQVLLLEITRAALADAGYSERSFPKQRTSVVLANAGHGPITALYSLRSMLDWKLSDLEPEVKEEIKKRLPDWTEDSFPGYLGNVTARVANRFDLGGINFSVDAACASSLAALYISVGELRNHNSDVVFLCASDTHNQPGDYLSFSKTHAFSPGGRCRTFDATADGIVISEGMAMLVLKRLADAERDGDRVYAVIRGVGGSSDGRDLSLTAPRPAGQMSALRRAYADAGISPATVSLVEAHGTGTVAGDKAEIEALKQVFDAAGAKTRACAVGSVKTMIGHTKAAAGLASLIKVAKALHHKVLPPTIGVKVPNPACDFAHSPFYINSEARPWLNPEVVRGLECQPLRAGVSAFGFGGTNFHVVLEEYVPALARVPAPPLQDWPGELFLLRGRSRAELFKSLSWVGDQLKKLLASNEAPVAGSLKGLAHQLYLRNSERLSEPAAKPEDNQQIQARELCLAIVASSLGDLEEKLSRAKSDLLDNNRKEIKDPRGIYFTDGEFASPKVAFLFPGQGSQQVEMLKDLALAFPEVRETFERSSSVLAGKLERPLTDYIFPQPAFTDDERASQQRELTNTHIAQPAVGAADLALLNLLKALNVKADMVAGHSYGEYVALCAAGAFCEEDLLRISEMRGRLLAQKTGAVAGSMAAVASNADEVKKILERLSGVTLANINSPTQCVISGEQTIVDNAVSVCKEYGMAARVIPVSQAFHSAHMVHAKAPLKAALDELDLKAAQIPVYSNTDGCTYPPSPSHIAQKLSEHITAPVDFVTEIENMYTHGARIFVEVGPGAVLTGLVDSILKKDPGKDFMAIASDRSGRNGIVQLLHALAQLAAAGVPVDQGILFRNRFDDSLTLTAMPQAVKAPGPGRFKLLYSVNSVAITRLDNKNTVATTGNTARSAPNLSHPEAVEAKASTARPHMTLPPTAPEKAAQRLQMTETKTLILKESNSPSAQAPDHNGNNGHPPNASPARPPKVAQAATDLALSAESKARPAAQLPQAHAPAQPTPGFGQPMPPWANMNQTWTGTQFNAMQPQGGQFNQLPANLAFDPALMANAGNADQVMMHFQQTLLQMTNNFLLTQQQVMLSYLQTRGGAQPLRQPFAPMQMAAAPTAQFVPYNKPQAPSYQKPATEAASSTANQKQNLDDWSLEEEAPSPTSEPSALAAAPSQLENEGSALTLTPAGVALPANGEDTASGSGLDTAYDADELVAALLDIVSQRTGYPPEMLDPTLDLEADLGIDSIKRVEILNSFRKLLPQAKQAQLEGGIEELAGTKTLEGIISWIRKDPAMAAANDILGGNGNGHNDQGKEIQVSQLHVIPADNNGHGNGKHGNSLADVAALLGQRVAPASEMKRALVAINELPAAAPGALSGNFLLTSAGGAQAEALSAELASRGARAIIINHGDKVTAFGKNFTANLLDQGQITDVMARVKAESPVLNGLIHCLGVGEKESADSLAVRTLFVLAKSLENEFTTGSAATEPALLAISRLGGRFGSAKETGNEGGTPTQAALSGFVKSIAKEWPGVACKAIDFDDSVDDQAMAKAIADELATRESRVEIGRQGPKRLGLDVVYRAHAEKEGTAPPIDSQSVILVTGGARGITAEIAFSLAAEFQPTLILVGRASEPDRHEDAHTRSLTTAKDLKAAIMEQLKFEQKPLSITTVEQIYQKLMRDREIRENLARLKEVGARVVYKSVDVRDQEAFTRLIGNLYNEYGKIDGVVHGAGIIEDGFVKQKSLESFERVYLTKVKSAFTLSNALRLSELKFLILFSSVVGRTGNAGQTDYVAANEVVNKLAVELDQKTQGRVASLMWGPWKGGMANPELESIFARYGWAMIGAEEGRKAFLDELKHGKKGDVEVLLVAELLKQEGAPKAKGARLHEAEALAISPGNLEFHLNLSPAVDLYLKDHTFDNVPVMPMAFSLELMAEAVASAYPDWQIERVHNLDIPSGIVFEANSKQVVVDVTEHTRSEAGLQVKAALCTMSPKKRVNFKAVFELTQMGAGRGNNGKNGNHSDKEIPSFVPTSTDWASLKEFSEPLDTVPVIENVYGNWLFHGPLFQHIVSIDAIGTDGIAGRLAASRPENCLARAGAAEWTIDPILLDSAMQLAGVWARQFLEITALPTGFRKLHLFRERAAKNFYARCFMDPSTTATDLTCNVAVYTEEGKLALLLEGLGGVGSKSLNRLASQAAPTSYTKGTSR